jgi:transcriptional regulator with XRE-family HTH domain
MTPSEITQKYRKQQGLTLQEFAIALSDNGEHVSKQKVQYWESGKFNPNRWFLHRVAGYYPQDDWRHNWAMDILAEL